MPFRTPPGARLRTLKRRIRAGNGSFAISVAASCAIVIPPPEYNQRAPGVVSFRTAGVFAGGRPSRSWGTVGTGLSRA